MSTNLNFKPSYVSPRDDVYSAGGRSALKNGERLFDVDCSPITSIVVLEYSNSPQC
jgi:hypothetical protein